MFWRFLIQQIKRKLEDVLKKLEVLYSKLSMGSVRTVVNVVTLH